MSCAVPELRECLQRERSLEQIGERMEQGGKARMNEDKEGSAPGKGWPQVPGSECKGKGRRKGRMVGMKMGHRGTR